MNAPAKQNTNDNGTFEVTHRVVLGLAVPMTLAYLTTPILGLVDTAVVGRLGSAALIGGLAVGSIIVDVLFTTFNFQRSGTTGLTAQAVGAGDETEKRAILLRALIIAAVAGIAMVVITPLILGIALWLMAPGEAVAQATAIYFSIRMLSAPFTLANYAVLGWLIGLGRADLGLGLQIGLNGLNIVLSIWLGLGLGWGIAGVATATVIAEIAAMIAGLCIAYFLAGSGRLPGWAVVSDLSAIKRLMKLNGDIMIRSFVLLSAFAFFTAQGAKFGEVTLAANAVLIHLVMIAGYFLDGMATAAEQIAGRTIGARYRKGFMRGLKLTLIWNSVLAVVLCAVFLLAGETLIATITTLESVQREAGQYLVLAALASLTGVLAFQMDGVYIGATWSREMSTMMVISFVVYLLAWWLLQPLGNTGLWLALHVFFLVRGITLSARLPLNIRRDFDQAG